MSDVGKPPHIDDAPGHIWRKRKRDRWELRWHARTDLILKGFTPKSEKLWTGTHEEFTDVVQAMIQDRCRALQDEMLVWGRGGLPVVGVDYDATVRTLINCYQSDPDSPYRKLRYISRKNYDSFCKRIRAEHGHELIENIKGRTLRRWHEKWCGVDEHGNPVKIAAGHSLIGIFRTLVGFGMTILECEHCTKLSAVMGAMRFPMGKARTEALTAEQATLIRNYARGMNEPMRSMALAQAFQFEGTLRQKDVIGEWVPMSEPGPPSDVIWGNEKWLRGIRWEAVDENLILRHITSKRQKPVEINLRHAPMVCEELLFLYGSLDRAALPVSGPIIVFEKTGAPYTAVNFRRHWREIANKVGIPATVRNMDSRAGAITEALASGARLEAVRKTATHSTTQMTNRYSRGDAEDIAEVMQLRVLGRNKNGTK